VVKKKLWGGVFLFQKEGKKKKKDGRWKERKDRDKKKRWAARKRGGEGQDPILLSFVGGGRNVHKVNGISGRKKKKKGE